MSSQTSYLYDICCYLLTVALASPKGYFTKGTFQMQQKTKTTVWMETQTFIFFSSYIEPVPKFFKKKKKKKWKRFWRQKIYLVKISWQSTNKIYYNKLLWWFTRTSSDNFDFKRYFLLSVYIILLKSHTFDD